MLKEFKEFAMKGNVLDMAVGIIIGAAFGKIITSLVSDVIMPPTTTIPVPSQNSHQIGPTGSAIPPTVKPTMMMETATQEAGRPV